MLKEWASIFYLFFWIIFILCIRYTIHKDSSYHTAHETARKQYPYIRMLVTKYNISDSYKYNTHDTIHNDKYDT